jgi:hypothetical protein
LQLRLILRSTGRVDTWLQLGGDRRGTPISLLR